MQQITSCKVCHVISGDLWAGAEVMVYNLLQNFKKICGVEVIAILFNEGKLAKELRMAGLTIYIVDEYKLSTLNMIFKMKQIFIKENVKIVHSHRYKENFLSLLASVGRLPVITTIHGMTEFNSLKKIDKHRLLAIVNTWLIKKMFSKVIPVSFEIEEHFKKKVKISKRKLVTIHNGIVIGNDLIHKVAAKTLVIGSAGRLFRVKNFEFLIDVAASLIEYDIVFKIAGDGPDRELLAKKCDELNLNDNVQFCGNIANMSIFYSTLDVYINTSLHEGIPMTILEAMSHSLPVIAPNVGGIPEIITHGKNGFLITSGDKEKFSEYCILLFQNRALCSSIGLDARRSVEDSFSIESCTKQYNEVYQECL